MTAISDAAFGLQNPMTSENDIIVGGTAGDPDRLGIGIKGDVLTVGDSGLLYADVTHSAYDVIDYQLLAAPSTFLTFDLSDQSYQTIIIEGQLRVDGNTGSNFGLLYLSFNNDNSGGNAHYTGVTSNIGGASSLDNNNYYQVDQAIIGYINAHLAPDNAASYVKITITNYTGSTFFKNVYVQSTMQPEDTTQQEYTALTSAVWLQQDPITSVRLVCDAGNFIVDSVMTVYGIANNKITNQRLQGSIPALALDYNAPNLYNNITFTTNSWQDFGPLLEFKSHDLLSITELTYGGYGTVSAGSNTNLVFKVILDGTIERYVGGVYIIGGQTYSFLNNIAPIEYTNLSSGLHTIQLQINPKDNDIVVYCMPQSTPGYAFTVQAVEFIPPIKQVFPTPTSGFIPLTTQTLQKSQTTLSLSTIPQDLQSLKILLKVRGTNPSNIVSMFFRLNGDTNNVYETILNLTAHSVGPSRVDFDAQTSGAFGDIPGAFSSVWNYAYYTIDIPFYTNTLSQGITWSSNSFDATNSMLTALGNTQYHGTTGAVKSLDVFLSNGDFAANSSISLYGLVAPDNLLIRANNSTNLSQVVVATAQDTIDFPTIPLGYTNIDLTMNVRSTLASTDTEYLLITLNGDTGSNYTNELLYGDNSSGATSALDIHTGSTIANIVADNAAAGVLTPVTIKFVSYDSDVALKSYIVESYLEYTSGSFRTSILGGRWSITDPITSISLSLGSGQFAPNSIATLSTTTGTLPGSVYNPYFQEVLSDTPIAYWMLDETQTSFVYDASGNGNTAINGGGAVSTTTGLPSGGLAMAFDGTGAIELPIDLPNNFNDYGPIGSLEFWFKSTDSSNSSATLICTDVFVSQTTTGYLNTYANIGNFSSGTTYCDNVWHHVVYNYNESTQLMDIWIDGREVLYQQSYTSQVSQSGVINFRIGAYQDPGSGGYTNKFTGSMSHVAFYNRNLSPNRIATHYFAGITIPVSIATGGSTTGVVQSILFTLASDIGPVSSGDVTTNTFPSVSQNITVHNNATLRVRLAGSVTAGNDVDAIYFAPVLDSTTFGLFSGTYIPANLRTPFTGVYEFTALSAGTHTITLNYFSDSNNVFIRPITYPGLEALYIELEEIH